MSSRFRFAPSIILKTTPQAMKGHWWNQHKIDPLLVASALWHHGRMPSTSAASPEGPDTTSPVNVGEGGSE